MADIYSKKGIEERRDDDCINNNEEGFMRGYLAGDAYA